jgi:hypothetical protein
VNLYRKPYGNTEPQQFGLWAAVYISNSLQKPALQLSLFQLSNISVILSSRCAN